MYTKRKNIYDALSGAARRIAPLARINGAIRARLQERKAQRGLNHYRREAARLAISCPEGEELKLALRNRLAKRRSGRGVKPKGKLRIFLAYYVVNWESILPLALEPFGQVIQYDWKARGYDNHRSDWNRRRDEMNREMLRDFHQVNNVEPIDAVVGYLSGDNTAPETLLEMANSGAAIFNFCFDDKLNFPGMKRGGRYISPAAIAQAVDLNLTNAPDSIIKYAVHGGLAMFCPGGAHPEIHHTVDEPFRFDVSFIGARYGWRSDFIRRLERIGIKVECFGSGWPNGRVTVEQMIRLYSHSRINLGFSGVGHSRRLMCLKGRDFEVPMSGGLYLTQDNPELALVYEIGKEIMTYTDERDCAEKISYLLDHPEQAAAIRLAGRQRCLAQHTWQKRFEQMFTLAGIIG